MRLQVSVPRWWPCDGEEGATGNKTQQHNVDCDFMDFILKASWKLLFWLRGVLKSPSTVRKGMCWRLSDIYFSALGSVCCMLLPAMVEFVQFSGSRTQSRTRARPAQQNGDEAQMQHVVKTLRCAQQLHGHKRDLISGKGPFNYMYLPQVSALLPRSLTASSALKIGRHPKGKDCLPTSNHWLKSQTNHLGCISRLVNSGMIRHQPQLVSKKKLTNLRPRRKDAWPFNWLPSLGWEKVMFFHPKGQISK